MMKITIVFKNGYQFNFTCESCTLERDYEGNLTGIKANGITDSKPLYIDFENVLCIYRDMESE